MHCLLAETFGEYAPKPFRLFGGTRREVTSGVLYGYVSVDARQLIEAATTFADPLQAQVIPRESIQTKLMPDTWDPGRRLGFEVLVRPVIRRTRNAGRPGAEVDVFKRMEEQVQEDSPTPSREDAYVRWLSTQLASHGGASLIECRLHSFRIQPVVRRRRGPAVRGPSAVMRGKLTIGEGEAFSHVLGRGIGRHRSYGYGMLLVRPIRS